MAAAPAAFGAPASARDREGAARRGANWHAWIPGFRDPYKPRRAGALSILHRAPYIVFYIVFFLIIAAPQVTNFVPFSGRFQYGNANPRSRPTIGAMYFYS